MSSGGQCFEELEASFEKIDSQIADVERVLNSECSKAAELVDQAASTSSRIVVRINLARDELLAKLSATLELHVGRVSRKICRPNPTTLSVERLPDPGRLPRCSFFEITDPAARGLALLGEIKYKNDFDLVRKVEYLDLYNRFEMLQVQSKSLKSNDELNEYIQSTQSDQPFVVNASLTKVSYWPISKGAVVFCQQKDLRFQDDLYSRIPVINLKTLTLPKFAQTKQLFIDFRNEPVTQKAKYFTNNFSAYGSHIIGFFIYDVKSSEPPLSNRDVTLGKVHTLIKIYDTRLTLLAQKEFQFSMKLLHLNDDSFIVWSSKHQAQLVFDFEFNILYEFSEHETTQHCTLVNISSQNAYFLKSAGSGECELRIIDLKDANKWTAVNWIHGHLCIDRSTSPCLLFESTEDPLRLKVYDQHGKFLVENRTDLDELRNFYSISLTRRDNLIFYFDFGAHMLFLI